jgi:hypothetical protein
MIWFVVVLAAAAGARGMWSPCGLSMLTSLNPMAERSRGHRFATSASWYIAGALVGGAVLGIGCAFGAWVFSLVGPSTSIKLALAAAVALVGFASDAKILGWSLPDHPRQVNERWLSTYRRWLYASGFGAQIGFGFATYIMTAAVYVTAACAVLTADPLMAMIVCLTFAAVRGLAILVAVDLTTPARLIRRAGLLDRSDQLSLQILTWAQALLAVALAALWLPVVGIVLLVAAGAVASRDLTHRRSSRANAAAASFDGADDGDHIGPAVAKGHGVSVQGMANVQQR